MIYETAIDGLLSLYCAIYSYTILHFTKRNFIDEIGDFFDIDLFPNVREIRLHSNKLTG